MKSLYNLSIRLKVTLILATFIVLVFAGLSLSNYFTSQKGIISRIKQKELPVFMDNIYNSIQVDLWKDIMVSDVISNSSFLMNWLKTEEDSLILLNEYLKIIDKEYGLYVTIISDASLNYYSTNGFERTMNENTDPWYFGFKKSNKKKGFNVDADFGSDEVKLWVNHKIIDSNNNFLGVASVGLDLSELVKFVLSKKYGEKGNIMMVDVNGEITIHENTELIGSKNKNEAGKKIHELDGYNEIADMLLQDTKESYTYTNSKNESYIVISRFIPEFNWYIIAEVSESEITSEPRAIFLKNIFVGILITILIIILAIFLVNQHLITPINYIVDIIKKTSEGYFNQSIKISRKDELGQIMIALQHMQDNTKRIVNEILINTDSINAASSQISGSSHQLSQGANEQASSIEEVSASMEQMLGTIHQNSENAKETENISTKAAKNISTVASSSEKSLSSVDSIAEKISIINDIAFQTNLLALNAAVEAARAGESGKGFAVVAAEVRKLAERSKIAADEINQLSHHSLESTKEAKEMMLSTFPEIQKTSELVKEISASSVEQITGAEQVSNAVQQLNNVAQQNAATSEELASSADLFKEKADSLRQSVAFFKTE